MPDVSHTINGRIVVRDGLKGSSMFQWWSRILAVPLSCASLAVAASPAKAAQFTDPVRGYSVKYPDTWTLQQYPSGAIEIRNFPVERMLYGGNVPLGGAQILLTVEPPYPRGWSAQSDEYAIIEGDARSGGGTDIKCSSRTSAGPARCDFVRETASDSTNKCVRMVLRKGGKLFDFFMEYQEAGPAGPSYERTLTEFVHSLQLLPSSPAAAADSNS